MRSFQRALSGIVGEECESRLLTLAMIDEAVDLVAYRYRPGHQEIGRIPLSGASAMTCRFFVYSFDKKPCAPSSSRLQTRIKRSHLWGVRLKKIASLCSLPAGPCLLHAFNSFSSRPGFRFVSFSISKTSASVPNRTALATRSRMWP